MARLDEVYSVDELPESESNFELVPAGWYQATIDGAEVCHTKSGSGQYIKLKHKITGPTHAGRVLFQNLNIRNANPKAEEIGRRQLGDLLRAVGLPRIEDTDELIGAPVAIKVAIREASDGFEAQNDVKGIKAASGSPAPMPAPVAQFPQAKAPASKPASSTPPWRR